MLIIDRFEGYWAVIEFNKSTFNIPKLLLPKDVKEGDIININITIDKATTEKRKKMVIKIADNLFED